MFKPPSLAPYNYRLLLWFLRAIAAPSMIGRQISSAVRSFSWHTIYLMCPPTRINPKMSTMTNSVVYYAELDEQLLPLKYSVTHQQKCDGEQSFCTHVSSDLRGKSVLRVKWWMFMYEAQAIVWCSTSVAMYVPIRSSQTRPHYNVAEEGFWKILKIWWLGFLLGRRRILYQVASNLALRLFHQKHM
jgi:hypothetical protein